MEIARTIGEQLGEESSLANLGTAYYSLGQYQLATDYYQQSLEIARKIGSYSGVANALTNLGDTYSSLGELQLAIEYYQQSLEIARKIGDRWDESTALNNLGNTYGSLGQYQQALEFHQQALAIAEVLGDTGHREKVLGEITQIFTQIGEFERALAIAQVIQDQQKRLEELTRVVEVVSRLEGSRVREILASLRTDSDQRIRALVSRYVSTGTREALVVGINQYPLLGETLGSSAKHLETPARDAEAIASGGDKRP